MTGSRLAALLDQATPGPWSASPLAWNEPSARLIALAPDMARLLVDMAARIPVWGQGMTDNDWREAESLLARFAALDEKAGGA